MTYSAINWARKNLLKKIQYLPAKLLKNEGNSVLKIAQEVVIFSAKICLHVQNLLQQQIISAEAGFYEL